MNIKFDTLSKKLVLYPVLTNSKKILINLSSTTSILSDTFPQLRNAFVIISDNDVPVDTVLMNSACEVESRVIPQIGHKYGFSASAEGFDRAKCYAELPNPVESFVVDTSYISDPLSFKYIVAKVTLKDKQESNDFYRATIYRKRYCTTQVYRGELTYDSCYIHIWKPSVLTNSSIIDYFMTMQSTYVMAEDEITFEDVKHFRSKIGTEVYFDGWEFYFTDLLFNGKNVTFSLITDELNKSNFPERYIIEVTTISEDLYKGLKSYARYGSKEDANLPFSEDVSIYSAVEGGYGFPVAYTTRVDSSYWMPGLK